MKKKMLVFCVVVLVFSLGVLGCTSNEEVSTAVESEQQEEKTDEIKTDEIKTLEEHAHGDYEWIGEFELKSGKYMLHFGASEDETMDIGFIKMGSNIADLDHHASHLMVTDKEIVIQDSTFEAKPDFAYTLEMNEDHGHIYFEIKEDGLYAIVTEHFPQESNMQIFDSNKVEILPIAEHQVEGHTH